MYRSKDNIQYWISSLFFMRSAPLRDCTNQRQYHPFFCGVTPFAATASNQLAQPSTKFIKISPHRKPEVTVASITPTHEEIQDANHEQQISSRGSRRKHNRTQQTLGNPLFKTEICRSYMAGEICRFSKVCAYAHGPSELRNRPRVENFKTRPCEDLAKQNGFCKYGDRCSFAHPGEWIRRQCSGAYYDSDYQKTIEAEHRETEAPFGFYI